MNYEVYREDFITLNPFLGIDSIEPYFNACIERNKGLFLLVKTSNPNSGQLQDLRVNDQYLYEYMGSLVRNGAKP
jgi:orotidine-5'-phosphate decarboxylase